MDSSADADAMEPTCTPASADAGSPSYLLAPGPLPFVVDTHFFASEWEGDNSEIQLGAGLAETDAGKADETCGGDRSSASAQGNCYKWTYGNVAAGAVINDAGATAKGFAAVEYQSLVASGNYPANTGTAPGVVIPPGATMVSFWARGAVGGEVVAFGVGQIDNAMCNDAIIVAPANQTLTTTWTHYTIEFPTGQSYASGQIIGFSWSATYQANGPGDGGSDAATGDASAAATPITFFIDNIEWVGPTSDAGAADAASDAGSSDASGQ